MKTQIVRTIKIKIKTRIVTIAMVEQRVKRKTVMRMCSQAFASG